MGIPKISSFVARGFSFIIHLIVISLMGLAVSTATFGQEPLVLGVHPYLPYETIEEKFAPLAAYISEKIGRPVVVRVGGSYQDHIAAIGRDQLDIAYIGPAEYVSLVKKYGPKPLIVCQETDGLPFFRGIIIVRNDSPAASLADLGEGNFAFVDKHSTMGYLVPLAMLQQENPLLITTERYQFLKTHEDVVLAVLAGDFAAGAVKEAVYHKFKAKGLKALVVTPVIAEHLFVARSTLAAATVNQLRSVLLNLETTPEGHDVLQSIKLSLTGFAPVSDDDYNSLRQLFDRIDQKDNVR